jgi:hypothetical protein
VEKQEDGTKNTKEQKKRKRKNENRYYNNGYLSKS